MKLGKALGKPIFMTAKPSRELVLPEAKVGIEIEFERWDGLNPTTFWEDVNENSVRNKGREFITRGGMVGEQIVEAVHEFCTLAKEHNYSEGTPRAAIHIHVDCTDLDIAKGELATLVSLYSIMEHTLFSFAGEWRRGCGFCDALEDSEADLEHLSKAMYDKEGEQLMLVVAEGYLHKYQALNLLSLYKYGTVEFRILPTTFDEQRIITWINILLQLKNAAQNFDRKLPLLAQFSRMGATGFAKHIMGGMWKDVEEFYKEERAWSAIDIAIAMLSYGQQLSITPEITPEKLWDKYSDKPLDWVASKIKRLGSGVKQPADKINTARAAPPADALQVAGLGNGRNGFIQRLEQAGGAQRVRILTERAARERALNMLNQLLPEGER